MTPAKNKQPQSPISAHDIYLFREGSHGRLYDCLGAHPAQDNGTAGFRFGVWAPNAEAVSVVGDFNDWQAERNALLRRDDGSGLWEGFVAGAARGDRYKFHITAADGFVAEKADPFACRSEEPPLSASRLWTLEYEWGDTAWMVGRHAANALDAPMSVYEVHLGSWRRIPEEDNRSLSYREMAPQLADYVREMGFTHVELLPVTEHPFYGSWGYQTTGYFTPTARYGTPQDFMFLIDTLHQAGIGVILDWVPSHFPADGHGLANFDGTCLYEHADPRQGYHPDWSSSIFNYGRNEVRGFLMSSALFWLEKYHIDGIRVDAVASMLYLDCGRKADEWIPNIHGGRENLEAMSFLRSLNEAVYRDHPDVQVIAEESTAWPMVSRPTYMGGLGFGMKWNMGWMHDMLKYFQQDPLYRKYNHNQLTFALWYAFTENFVLPLSHDEVVHGKGSLIGKMPGDEWQQFANLRALFGLMWAHPGKKLLFMGGEFGQKREWQHEESLEWNVLQYPLHEGTRRWVADLNRVYRQHTALHQKDFVDDGFSWVDFHDWESSVISFLRYGKDRDDFALVVCNFTPVPHHNYTVGVPRGGQWEEILNSDAEWYGGSGMGNFGRIESAPLAAQGHYHSLALTLPPLSVLVLKPVKNEGGQP
ncbi:MAG: 1,4-alpha-glucan branching protein GlgB [Gammaproteobacteria bacterium]|nr:1,4-alpha-glucan branching protein GlgB [Gammaproteobacteria bacterium]